MDIQTMLNAHPRPPERLLPQVAACVNNCYACAAACTSCADACLAEQDPALLRSCISLNMTCADLCYATGRIASRMVAEEPAIFNPLLAACEQACRLCAEECEQHAHHEHCAVCAQQCRRCETACRELAGAEVRGELTAQAGA